MVVVKRQKQLLQTVLQVSRFLLVENDFTTMLQGICDRMTDTQSPYQECWLVLIDTEHGGVITAESGLGEKFDPIMDDLRRGILPHCGELVLESGSAAAIVCNDCTTTACTHRAGGDDFPVLASFIACRENLSGFFVVQQTDDSKVDKETLQILGDLGTSIGQALKNLLQMEEAVQRERELKRIEERFELALYATQAGLWDWNIKTGEMFTSPDNKGHLDYREGEESGIGGWQGLIHPEDKKRVMQVLSDHLSGKTEEYRIEYRVKDEEGAWRWFLDRGRVVERDGQHMPVRMTGTHQDISRQKEKDMELATAAERLHAAVEKERSFLQTVIDSAGDPFMVIDMDFHVLLMNEAAANIMAVSKKLTGSEKCYRLFCDSDIPCTDDRFPCPVEDVRRRGKRTNLVHNPLHGNKVNNTFELEVSPLHDQNGQLLGIIEVARDITDRLRIENELRNSQSRLYQLAHHDALTGLPNRLLFKDRLERAIAKAQRNKSKVAILFLDLDRFKNINDTLGHDVGDDLLVEVAKRLQKQCRKSDTVARLGGDEFVFILEDIQQSSDIAVVAKKILDAMKRRVIAGEHELFVSTSIGIGIFPDDSNDTEGVIKCADTALYRAKEDGRSNYKFYKTDMDTAAYQQLLLETELRKAISEEQFYLEYQPQFDLKTKQLTGFEALIRWNHPEHGLVPPNDFIPLAEENGLIVSIGSWVIEQVCRQMAAWQEAGLALVPIAVNVSARQFRDKKFVAHTSNVVQQSGIEPKLLEIELTESTVMDKVEETIVELERITRFGIRLAVDDFGTGYSSLAYLQRFPLNRLKIDQSFVREIANDRSIHMIIQAIITMAHSLGLTVLAEGVEENEQLHFLEENNCDQVQGYLLGHPLSGENAVDLLVKSG